MKRTLILIMVLLLAAACASKRAENPTAEQLLSEGRELFLKEKYTRAAEKYEQALAVVENPEQAATAQIMVADCYYLDENYEDAIPAYEVFLDYYRDMPEAGRAQFRLAMSYYASMEKIGRDPTNTEKALAQMKILLRSYPEYAKEVNAEAKVQELRNRLAAQERTIADFYFRIWERKQGALRLRYIIERYSDTPEYEYAIYRLALYLAKRTGELQEAQALYEKLKNERPDSAYVAKTANVLQKYTR